MLLSEEQADQGPGGGDAGRNKLSSIVGAMGWTTFSTFVVIVVGLALNLIVGNVFGDDGLGVYSLASAIYLFVGVVANVGQSFALVKHTAEHIDTPDIGRQFYGVSLLLGIGASLGAGLLLFLLRNALAALFDMPALAQFLPILAVALPLSQLNHIALARLSGLRQMRLFAVGESWRYLLLLLLTAGGAFLWPDQLAMMIWPLLIAEVLLVPFVWWATQLHRNVSFQNLGTRMRELSWFGSQVIAVRVIGELGARLDLVIAGYFLTSGDVGVYSVAVMLGRALTIPSSAVQKVATPLMAETYAKRQWGILEAFVNQAMQLVGLLATVMAIVSVVFFPEIITLLYPGQQVFLSGQMAFNILAVGFLLKGIGLAIASIYVSIGRPDIELKLALASLSLSSTLGVLLAVAGFGLNGIAAGSAVGSVAISILWIVLIPRFVGIEVYYGRLIVMPVLGLLIVAAILGLSRTIPPLLSTVILAGLLCLIAVRLYHFDNLLLRLGRSIRLGDGR